MGVYQSHTRHAMTLFVHFMLISKMSGGQVIIQLSPDRTTFRIIKLCLMKLTSNPMTMLFLFIFLKQLETHLTQKYSHSYRISQAVPKYG